MRKNRIIGAKYLPTFYGEWQKGVPYAPLTMVTFKGDSYISKKEVPVNIDISNNGYWERTGQYNAQLENYIRQVRRIGEEVENARLGEDTLKDKIYDMNSKIINLEEMKIFLKYGAKGDGITDDGKAIQKAINDTPLNGVLYLPSGFTFMTNKKITVPRAMTIKGNCTIIKGSNFNDDFLFYVVAGITGFKMEDVYFLGNNKPGGGIIFGSRTNYCYLKNVRSEKMNNSGLFLTNTWNSNFEHLHIAGNSGGGVVLNNDCSGNMFYGGVLRQNRGGNVVLSNNTIFDNTFIGMMIEYSFKDNSDLTSPNGCIQVNGSRHNTFVGCEIANEPWNKLVNIVDCESIDFISCEFGRPNESGGHRNDYTNIPPNPTEIKAISIYNGRLNLDNCKFVNTVTKDLDIFGTSAKVYATNTPVRNINSYPKGTFTYINFEKNGFDDNSFNSNDKLTIYSDSLFLLGTNIIGSGTILQNNGSYFRLGALKPTQPQARDCYYNSNLKKPVIYDGTNWRDFTGNIVSV